MFQLKFKKMAVFTNVWLAFVPFQLNLSGLHTPAWQCPEL